MNRRIPVVVFAVVVLVAVVAASLAYVHMWHTIGRDDAIAIARAKVVSQYPDATIALESATLKVTSAPGLTGGKTMRIWTVVFTGKDPSGIAAGGWVYVDAHTGAIVQYAVPG